MSEYHGFKCDRCGAVYSTGIRMSGDRKAEVQCGRVRRPYRFDLCNDCYDEFMAFVCEKKPTRHRKLYDTALKFVSDIKRAHNSETQKDELELVDKALVEYIKIEAEINETEIDKTKGE